MHTSNEQEDYVDFEVAELLKQAGFNWKTTGAYYYANKTEVHVSIHADYNGYGFRHICVSAPTIQMAMKYLRNVHKLAIQVFPVFESLKWCYDIYELKVQEYHSRPNLLSDIDFDMYEQACKHAIKHCLTTVIHQINDDKHD